MCGTVRVGRKTVTVPEFSTDSRIKADAEAAGAAEDARIRAEVLDTGALAKPPHVVTVGECIAAYKAPPGGLHPFDIVRLTELDAAMGRMPLSAARDAWSAWLRARGKDLATSPVARWQAVLRATLHRGAEEFGVTVPHLRPVKGAEVERIAYLTKKAGGALTGRLRPVGSAGDADPLRDRDPVAGGAPARLALRGLGPHCAADRAHRPEK